MSEPVLLGELLEQAPPTNLDAERCVIGSVILDATKRSAVSFLSPGDFALDAHGTLFRVLMEMEAVDDVLLLEALRNEGTLERAGGAAYLAELIHSVPVAAHAAYYARIVKDLARKRAFIQLNCDALRALYSGRWPVEELIQRQVERLGEL